MQVAHAQDHVTHAFLGAKESRAVGISDDPAFFQILSSTLYKDQKLAVVRETICNAWDAHIEAGKTDLPIEITIDGLLVMAQVISPPAPTDSSRKDAARALYQAGQWTDLAAFKAKAKKGWAALGFSDVEIVRIMENIL